MKTNTQRKPDRFTHEGAPAKRITSEQQLRRSVTACLLWEDTFYESGADIAQRIRGEARNCSSEYIRDLALEVRQKHGIRHAPLWLTLALIERGGKIAGDTVRDVISRADELTEVVSMYWKDGRKPLSAQLKRGLAEAFLKFDEYQLQKWDRRDANIRMRDVMFLAHPKPANEDQAALFKRVADDSMASADTWESALSKGGDKKAEFERLLRSGKLGYLATLRNLRNMQESGVDRDLIRERLAGRGYQGILPFQFIAAANAVPMYTADLDQYMVRSAETLPKLKGSTAVIVDASGSMNQLLSQRGTMKRIDAACGVAINAIVASEEARLFAFGDRCKEVSNVPTIGMRDAIFAAGVGWATNAGKAIRHVHDRGHFDRIILITDEQTADIVGGPAPGQKGYVINVAAYRNGIGYHAWTHIDGFSEQTVRYVAEIESQ